MPSSVAETAEPVGGQLPRKLGRYLLFDHIGRGGMADIYLALLETDLGAPRRAVVKQILPRLAHDPAFAEMLVREAKLAAKLGHGNVVQVFDLGRVDDSLYIAMEYVEGFDLHQLLRRLSKRRIGLPAEFAALIICEALRGLDYAHRARDEARRPLGVVHRDVSPSNVLISVEGEVKLCDFGIARALERDGGPEDAEEAAAIGRTRLAGKSAYMSPEHARGEEIDARADVFAAGVLSWELFAGRRMIRGTEAEMLELARRGEAPELPERGLPEEARLRATLARALHPDRDARHQTAAELLGEIEGWAASAKLLASPLRFGQFLTEHFADEIVEARRARERAAQAVGGRRGDADAAGEADPRASERDPSAPTDAAEAFAHADPTDPSGAPPVVERAPVEAEPRGAADTDPAPAPRPPEPSRRPGLALLILIAIVATLAGLGLAQLIAWLD